MLSMGEVQALLADATGKEWLRILEVVRDNEVDGDSLSEHMGSPESLARFFREELDCPITPFVSKKLLQKLVGRTAAKAAAAVARDDGGGGGAGAAAADARLAQLADMAPLRVNFSVAGDGHADSDGGGGGGAKKVTVEVPALATAAAVRRCIIDHLALPLSATLVLTHAGQLLREDDGGGGRPMPIDWTRFSVVHAVQLPGDTPLTLANARAHAAVAAHVVFDSTKDNDPAYAAAAGWHLHVHDTGKPLGNGASGVVYEGVASLLGGGAVREPVRVAVKKFFMLEHPTTYGLMDAAAVAAVVEQELLPEVNVLLGLAHRNVVRLRCVGLSVIHGRSLPAYVAMDFCAEGTLQLWLDRGMLTDVCLVDFLGDLVDAMV